MHWVLRPSSCAHLAAGHKNAELLDRICDEAVRRGTDGFVAQALSNIVWGCATLEHVSPQALEVGCLRPRIYISSGPGPNVGHCGALISVPVFRSCHDVGARGT